MVAIPANLAEGYNRFRSKRYPSQSDLFATLAKGQSPKTMVVGCSDSRVEPTVLFDAEPGDLFVVRNVANIVPKFTETDGLHGVEAALEFAVTALKVSQIIVIGHSGCGGISACLSAANDKPVGHFIAPWVAQLAEVRDQVLGSNPDNAHMALEQAGVVWSVSNLMDYSFVKDAVNDGSLTLLGAWFDIGSGTLFWFNSETNAFVTELKS